LRQTIKNEKQMLILASSKSENIYFNGSNDGLQNRNTFLIANLSSASENSSLNFHLSNGKQKLQKNMRYARVINKQYE